MPAKMDTHDTSVTNAAEISLRMPMKDTTLPYILYAIFSDNTRGHYSLSRRAKIFIDIRGVEFRRYISLSPAWRQAYASIEIAEGADDDWDDADFKAALVSRHKAAKLFFSTDHAVAAAPPHWRLAASGKSHYHNGDIEFQLFIDLFSLISRAAISFRGFQIAFMLFYEHDIVLACATHDAILLIAATRDYSASSWNIDINRGYRFSFDDAAGACCLAFRCRYSAGVLATPAAIHVANI